MLKFKDYLLQEGNRLSRLEGLSGKGYHSVTISYARKDQTPQENEAAGVFLKNYLKTNGFGYKNTSGVWDEGEGPQSEPSMHVIAKKPGDEGADELLKHMTHAAKMVRQQAIIHRTPDGTGTAIYTTDTPDGEGNVTPAGTRVEYGGTHYNVDNPYGETAYTRGPKSERAVNKFTFK